MLESITKHLGLIPPIFVLFVAMSTVLGRAYHLSYLDALGIPESDVRVGIVDYPVVSIDATLLGMGVAIIPLVVAWSVTSVGKVESWNARRVISGLIAAVAAFVCGLVGAPLVALTSEFVGSGQYGFWWIVVLLATSMSLSYAATGVPDKFWLRGTCGEKQKIVGFLPLLIMMLVMAAVISAISQAVDVGRVDAESTLREAPRAIVRFHPTESLPAFSNPIPEECDGVRQDCVFRVLLIGDNFVHLTIEGDLVPTSGIAYAVPISGIASISYLRGDP